MGNVRVTAALHTGMAPPLQAIRDTVGHILQMSYKPSTEEMELLPRPLNKRPVDHPNQLVRVRSPGGHEKISFCLSNQPNNVKEPWTIWLSR